MSSVGADAHRSGDVVVEFVVVGGGIAAQRAAETLAWAGKSVLMVSDEVVAPYDRPPLSKDVLTGAQTLAEPPYFHQLGWHGENGVELRLRCAATGLNVDRRHLQLSDGSTVEYENLLIATGCRARAANVAGANLSGVHYLRNWGDAVSLNAAMRSARHIVVVGGGFIGAEVASCANRLGVSVAIVEATELPLLNAFGPAVARRLLQLHTAHGVEVHLKSVLDSFLGKTCLQAVRLQSGVEIPCDLAVVGLGVEPNTRWLQGTDLWSDNGVIVDEFCRTHVDGVFAAGDVTQWPCAMLGGRLIRVGHWDHAGRHGVAAADNMLGNSRVYADVPYFWSDQYGYRIQSVGRSDDSDTMIWRGSGPVEGTGLYLAEGKVVSAIGINRPKDIMAVRRMISSGVRVDPDALHDETVTLKNLMSTHSVSAPPS